MRRSIFSVQRIIFASTAIHHLHSCKHLITAHLSDAMYYIGKLTGPEISGHVLANDRPTLALQRVFQGKRGGGGEHTSRLLTCLLLHSRIGLTGSLLVQRVSRYNTRHVAGSNKTWSSTDLATRKNAAIPSGVLGNMSNRINSFSFQKRLNRTCIIYVFIRKKLRLGSSWQLITSFDAFIFLLFWAG